jgi:hypothetical protein
MRPLMRLESEPKSSAILGALFVSTALKETGGMPLPRTPESYFIKNTEIRDECQKLSTCAISR